jgi:hypothetical protein
MVSISTTAVEQAIVDVSRANTNTRPAYGRASGSEPACPCFSNAGQANPPDLPVVVAGRAFDLDQQIL